MWFYVGIMLALALLVVLALRPVEPFADIQSVNMEALPEPQMIFKRLRGLLDKYDQPGVWAHAAAVMDKDPAELARMHLQQQGQKEGGPQ